MHNDTILKFDLDLSKRVTLSMGKKLSNSFSAKWWMNMFERWMKEWMKTRFTERTTFIINSIAGTDPAKQFSDATRDITHNGASWVHNSVNGFHQWSFIRKKKKVEVTFDGNFLLLIVLKNFPPAKLIWWLQKSNRCCRILFVART